MRPTPGITEPRLSREPLGTEGELTGGPDDHNPFDEREATTKDDPAKNPDPFVFDDVGTVVDDVQLPAPGDGPRF